MNNITLVAAFPKEIERVEEVLEMYKSIGPSGRLGSILIEDLLKRAKDALKYQDTVEMIKLFSELKGVK